MTTLHLTPQLRGGTTAALAAAGNSLVPAEREPVLATDTGLIKFGDGIRTYNALPYNTSMALNALQVDPATAVDGTATTVSLVTGVGSFSFAIADLIAALNGVSTPVYVGMREVDGKCLYTIPGDGSTPWVPVPVMCGQEVRWLSSGELGYGVNHAGPDSLPDPGMAATTIGAQKIAQTDANYFANDSDWASTKPSTLGAAVTRLAAAVAGLLTNPIP